MNKEKLIKQEYDRLNDLYGNMPENKRKLIENLLQNAAFMAATLKELQEIVNDEGAVKTSTNGNGFTTTHEHPAQKSYNTMINRYSTVIRQLADLLPEQVAKSKLEEMMNA